MITAITISRSRTLALLALACLAAFAFALAPLQYAHADAEPTLSVSPSTVNTGKTVTAKAEVPNLCISFGSNLGYTVPYTLDWGDGNKITKSWAAITTAKCEETSTKTHTHAYDSTGTYSVKLTASATLGGTKPTTVAKAVKVTDDAAPTCTLSADPDSISGSNATTTLSWKTTNATKVTIDQGFDEVADEGSEVISPAKTTTYTLTATGPGGSTKCTETVTVKEDPDATTYTLSAKPSTVGPLASGKTATTTLTWTTQNATKVTIDKGIGTVAKNGSETVEVSKTTTFTMTVKGPGGTKECKTTVTVTDPDAPTCTLTAKPATVTLSDPTSAQTGSGIGTTVLTWTTKNATAVTIDQGVGSVAKNGSKTVTVKKTTTFTLTAAGAKGSKKCSTTVTVKGDDGDDDDDDGDVLNASPKTGPAPLSVGFSVANLGAAIPLHFVAFGDGTSGRLTPYPTKGPNDCEDSDGEDEGCHDTDSEGGGTTLLGVTRHVYPKQGTYTATLYRGLLCTGNADNWEEICNEQSSTPKKVDSVVITVTKQVCTKGEDDDEWKCPPPNPGPGNVDKVGPNAYIAVTFASGTKINIPVGNLAKSAVQKIIAKLISYDFVESAVLVDK